MANRGHIAAKSGALVVLATEVSVCHQRLGKPPAWKYPRAIFERRAHFKAPEFARLFNRIATCLGQRRSNQPLSGLAEAIDEWIPQLPHGNRS